MAERFLFWVGCVATALAVAQGALIASADDDRRPGPPGFMPPSPLLRFDLNTDGKVTRAEIDSAIPDEFERADKNGDHKLDGTEMRAYFESLRPRFDEMHMKDGGPGGPGRPPAPEGRPGFEKMDPIKRVDWNLDGTVSPGEFASSTRAIALHIDRDGDGTITADELRGPRRPPGPPPGPFGPPPPPPPPPPPQ